ncbi:MAG TPA: hypothetical protein VMP01_17035 [Pirellulaceae bacterium]|nr:hypothetical protein [Pirellulaceae bacterium]
MARELAAQAAAAPRESAAAAPRAPAAEALRESAAEALRESAAAEAHRGSAAKDRHAPLAAGMHASAVKVRPGSLAGPMRALRYGAIPQGGQRSTGPKERQSPGRPAAVFHHARVSIAHRLIAAMPPAAVQLAIAAMPPAAVPLPIAAAGLRTEGLRTAESRGLPSTGRRSIGWMIFWESAAVAKGRPIG